MIVDNGDAACVHALKGIGPLERQQPRMNITCLVLLLREARSLAQSPTASEEFISRLKPGNSLAVQWLGFCTLTTEGTGSISNLGTKIQQKRLQQVQKDMQRVRERDLYTDNLGARGRSRELQKHVWG